MRLVLQKMKCIRCGTEIPEGYDICADCADAEAAAATVDPYFAQPSFDCEQVPQTEKKSKKKVLIPVIAGVLAVVLVALVFLNFGTVKALCIKNFGTGEAYFAYVVKQDMEKKLYDLSNSYGKLYNRSQNINKTRHNKIDLEFSDEALNLLKNVLPEELSGLDLNNYKNININTEITPDAGNQQIGLLLGLGENELLNIRAILDMEGKDLYLGVLNLTDTYLKIEGALEEVLDNVNIAAMNGAVAEVLPTREIVNKILNKYCNLIIDAVGEMEKESKEINVGGFNQKLTALTYAPTETELLNITKMLLTELKADEDVKNLITSIDSFLAENVKEYPYEAGELYGKFTDALTEGLENLEGEPGGEEIPFTMIYYIDSKHDLVGVSIKDEEEKLGGYMKLKDGENFVFEAEIPDAELEITGKGVKKDDVVNAEYAIVLEGNKIADVRVEEFKKYSNEGNITILPSEEVLSELGGSAGSVASMLDPAVKISFKVGETSSMITCTIFSGDTEFATVRINGQQGKAQQIVIPSENAMPVDEIVEWANTISIDKVLQIVDNLALPEEYNQTVKSIADMAQQLGGIGNVLSYVLGG